MDFTKFAKLDENGQLIYPPHNDGNHMNVHVDPRWLADHGFEEHTQEWFDEHTPEPEPIPEPDRTDFDAACSQFRTVCAQIAEAADLPGFRGGFDEMVEFQQTAVYGTVAGLQLAIAWSALNELCKYEGNKIGLGQPQWWYECWASEDGEEDSSN